MDPITLDTSEVGQLVQRIRGEYLEMPGLHLTLRQAQRLWGLDEARCEQILGALVDARFLTRTHDGAFVRAGSPTRMSGSLFGRPGWDAKQSA